MELRVVTDSDVELMRSQEVRLPGWTEERYFVEAPENGFYELKDGDLIVHTPVSTEHQDITAFLLSLLRTFVSAGQLGCVLAGPAVIRLRENLNREPDIFFITSSRSHQIHDQYTEAPVDFVIEVTSEGGEARDLEEKQSEYAAAGVSEYWVVDPKTRRVVIHRSRGDRFELETVSEGRLESEAAPGFWIQVEWLWRRPLPAEIHCLDQLLTGTDSD